MKAVYSGKLKLSKSLIAGRKTRMVAAPVSFSRGLCRASRAALDDCLA